MKPTTVALLLLATSLPAACTAPLKVPMPSTTTPPQSAAEQEAIAVVRAAIQSEGGDPNLAEFTARTSDEGWDVYVQYFKRDKETGAKRYWYGGHCTYVLSPAYEVVKVIGGA